MFIRKVKMLKMPKFDFTKLLEIHGDSKEDIGSKVAVAEGEEGKGDSLGVGAETVQAAELPIGA